MFHSIILSFLMVQFTPAMAVIGGDLNCTTYNGTAFVWTPAATACSNLISDAACDILYPIQDAAHPAPGTDNERSLTCYTTGTDTPAPVVQDMKTAALQTCPRTCGLCCQTDSYSCPNAQFPRLNCNTITRAQCDNVNWRTIIAQDCPAACGLCGQQGCVDAVTNCGNDLTICNAIGLQSFVNSYCQRTCGRCPSTTASSSVTSTGTCTSYIADSSTNCASWRNNGFCTNTFYTLAQRRSRCATTCAIC